MTFEEFRDAAFKIATEKGCTAAETYYSDKNVFEVDVLEQDIDNYSVSNRCGISLRVALNGKNGYAYTEVLQEPEVLVLHAMDNAKAIESTDEHPMQVKCQYQKTNPAKNPLETMSEEEKIALAMDMEKAAKASDKRFSRISDCTVQTERGTTRIDNTLGLSAVAESFEGLIIINPILSENGVERDDYSFRFGAQSADIAGCAKDAAARAARKFGASPVKSGKYKIIFENRAMVSLLGGFAPMFSAEMAQKGMSLLAGKENTRVAADCVTIVDDPLDNVSPEAFDDEGTPSVATLIMENGVMRSLLHNLKTAKKAGCASTSNGSRGSAASPVSVSPTNLYIKAGNESLQQLTQKMGDGIVITSITGLHAGLSTVSGDFSLLAEGLLIENGKTVRPVEQVTVAGSFLPLMQAVTAVGSDFLWVPDRMNVGAPSVLTGELMVSGD